MILGSYVTLDIRNVLGHDSCDKVEEDRSLGKLSIEFDLLRKDKEEFEIQLRGHFLMYDNEKNTYDCHQYGKGKILHFIGYVFMIIVPSRYADNTTWFTYLRKKKESDSFPYMTSTDSEESNRFHDINSISVQGWRNSFVVDNILKLIPPYYQINTLKDLLIEENFTVLLFGRDSITSLFNGIRMNPPDPPMFTAGSQSKKIKCTNDIFHFYEKNEITEDYGLGCPVLRLFDMYPNKHISEYFRKIILGDRYEKHVNTPTLPNNIENNTYANNSNISKNIIDNKTNETNDDFDSKIDNKNETSKIDFNETKNIYTEKNTTGYEKNTTQTPSPVDIVYRKKIEDYLNDIIAKYDIHNASEMCHSEDYLNRTDNTFCFCERKIDDYNNKYFFEKVCHDYKTTVERFDYKLLNFQGSDFLTFKLNCNNCQKDYKKSKNVMRMLEILKILNVDYECQLNYYMEYLEIGNICTCKNNQNKTSYSIYCFDPEIEDLAPTEHQYPGKRTNVSKMDCVCEIDIIKEKSDPENINRTISDNAIKENNTHVNIVNNDTEPIQNNRTPSVVENNTSHVYDENNDANQYISDIILYQHLNKYRCINDSFYCYCDKNEFYEKNPICGNYNYSEILENLTSFVNMRYPDRHYDDVCYCSIYKKTDYYTLNQEDGFFKWEMYILLMILVIIVIIILCTRNLCLDNRNPGRCELVICFPIDFSLKIILAIGNILVGTCKLICKNEDGTDVELELKDFQKVIINDDSLIVDLDDSNSLNATQVITQRNISNGKDSGHED